LTTDRADPARRARPKGSRAVRRPSRRAVAAVAIPLVALVVLSNVGDALAPSLVDRHPAWLIALNARNRNLVFVTNSLDAWTYYGVGTARLLVSDPMFFLLGYWYGDAAVTWMERRTVTWGQLLRQIEGWFGKAAYPLIFLAPNNPICLFAGAAGMPLRAFFAVNLAGTVVRLYAIRRFGEAFDAPIDGILDWIADYRLPLLAVTVGMVVLSLALEARRGETEVESLVNLDDELDDIDHELHPGVRVDTDDGRPGSARPAGPEGPGPTDEPSR
jgi:membrane protein DedA with SNARE-associated domain